jgi:hypothetical protein
MDEKGENNTIESADPKPTESDRIALEPLEEAPPLTTDSGKKGDEEPTNHQHGETDSFKSLSDEESDEFISIKKEEEDESHDPDLDWDDEEILENVGPKKLKRWVVVSGILTAVISLLSVTLWWLFFIKDPPYPLPDALKIFKRQPTTNGLEKASISTFKHKIKAKHFSEDSADLDIPTQTHKGVQNQSVNNLSSGKPSNLEIRRKLSMIVTLRSDLIQKQKEIRDLQQTYRERINTNEEAILVAKRNAKVNTFAKAIKVKPIEYGLRTIHRRKIYISNLKIPLDRLHFASEELLYLERLAAIQQKMLNIAEGIDLKTLTRKIDRTLRKHQNGLNRLTVKTHNTPSPDLEATWREVLLNREKKITPKKTDPEKSLPRQQTQINMKILEEIQSGNLSRKQELTWLSPEGASVLSEWSGKVLYLNGLSALNSSTAKILARWEGDWLCLNGIKKISPDTAKSLSQWSGERLSLNGLNSISEETSRWLSSWKGMELEMVSLAEASPEAIQHLQNREHSGKKVYVSNSFRKTTH